MGFVTAVAVGGVMTAPATAGAATGNFGDLDPMWGGDGVVTTDGPAGANDGARDLTILPSGKVLVAGTMQTTQGGFDFALARYEANGDLDPTFGGGDGIVTTDIADGGAGSDDRALRMSVDGANDKIVLAGYSSPASPGSDEDTAFVRYNADGTLDAAFDGSSNGNGIVLLPVSNTLDDEVDAVTHDGTKIVAAGYVTTLETANDYRSDIMVVKLNSDGTLDASFDGDGGNGNGVVTVSMSDAPNSFEGAYAVGILDDGTIMAAGDEYDDSTSTDTIPVIWLKDTDGTLDTAYSADGKTTTDAGGNAYANDLVVSPDKATVTAVGSGGFSMVRYNQSDGSLDTAGFGPGTGIVTTPPSAFGPSVANATSRAIARYGSGYVVAGYVGSPMGSDFAVAVYGGSGFLDSGFGGDGTITTSAFDTFGPSEIGTAVGTISDDNVLTPDKVMIAGSIFRSDAHPGDFATLRYGPFVANPKTTITRPKATTTDQTPTLKFRVSEDADSRCKVDKQEWIDPCLSPTPLPHLSRGDHVVRVQSTDMAGNLEPTPAKRSFKIVRG
jgi:uncharacterized delta-60 repeat protein